MATDAAGRVLSRIAAGRNGCWVFTGSIGRHGYVIASLPANPVATLTIEALLVIGTLLLLWLAARDEWLSHRERREARHRESQSRVVVR
jgi:molybdopterin biosynthesis enzyme